MRDDIVITSVETTEIPAYNKVLQVVDKMLLLPISSRGHGQSLSMCEMLSSLLAQSGINSTLVETQVAVHDVSGDRVAFIGYSTRTDTLQSDTDTHVVLVTETTPPILVDMGIANKLPGNARAVVEPVTTEKGDQVRVVINHPTCSITYDQREGFNLPILHQRSVLGRIQTDNKIFSQIDTLKRLNYIGIVLSLFAFINVIVKLLTGW